MSWLDAVLGWVYPPKCALCGTIGAPAWCEACRSEAAPWLGRARDVPGVVSVRCVHAYEQRPAQAVKKLKYDRATSLAVPMAIELAEVAAGIMDVDLVVPVPIHRSRKFERGFNQSELLCSRMSLPVRPELLRRIRRTRPQVGLSISERLTNLKGAFQATAGARGRTVLLVDDVVTSGGTAMACAAALRDAGADAVLLLAFCGERFSPREA